MPFTSEAAASRWGDVYLAAGSRALSMAGDALAATTLALALQDRGAGGLAVSGLWLAATLPLVALAPLAGRLTDRFDSRVLLVGTGLAQAAVCAVLAFVSAPIAMIALVAVLAAGLAVTSPTFSALMPSMVTRDDLPRASAITQTASMIGTLLGPAAAGFLVGAFGTRPPLLIDAATYLAVAAAGPLLRTPRGGPAAARGSPPVPPPPGGVRARCCAPGGATRRRPVGRRWCRPRRGGCAPTACSSPRSSPSPRWSPASAASTSSRSSSSATPSAPRRRHSAWSPRRGRPGWRPAPGSSPGSSGGTTTTAAWLAACSCCSGPPVPVLVCAAAPAVWLVVPLWLAGGVLNGGLGVFSNVLVARRVPERARGRAFAGLSAAANGGAMCGYVLAGALLGPFSPRALVFAFGLAGLVAVLAAAVPVVRAIRQERVTSPAVA